MSDGLPVDPVALRDEVKSKYRAVAVDPHASYHFHTGHELTRRLGYDQTERTDDRRGEAAPRRRNRGEVWG